jgi:hypothetical protein
VKGRTASSVLSTSGARRACGRRCTLTTFVHHGFQCNSTEARVFNFLTPAGFEQLIVDNGTPARYDAGPIPDDQQAAHTQVPPEVYGRDKYHMRTFPPVST